MRAVFVSGPGGVGKTTVLQAAQRLLPPEWVFFEVDKCQARPHPHHPSGAVETDRRMIRAAMRGARAYVDEGFSCLVEMAVADPWRRSAAEELFADVPTLFLVLFARREVAMARVRSRGTDPQFVTWFERYYDETDWRALPGTIIDTSDDAVGVVARRLVELCGP